LFVLFGLLVFGVWPTLLGMVLVYCGKLWFLDRMVWLWEDTQASSPQAGLPLPDGESGTQT
jgi:hypothetical protein